MQKKENQEIGLQELIDQVRKELLALSSSPDPIFFVDSVELELAVKIVKDRTAGIKISVLGFAEANAGGTRSGEHGHVVRVSLSSLIPREDIYQEVVKDQATKEYLMRYMKRAFTKSGDMVGDM